MNALMAVRAQRAIEPELVLWSSQSANPFDGGLWPRDSSLRAGMRLAQAWREPLFPGRSF